MGERATGSPAAQQLTQRKTIRGPVDGRSLLPHSEIISMARKKLRKIKNERSTFVGEFVRYGLKSSKKSPGPDRTLLLKSVRRASGGDVLTDHLWFNVTEGFAALGNLTAGDLVRFDARVVPYTKGYRGLRVAAMIENPVTDDHKLSHPTNISKV